MSCCHHITVRPTCGGKMVCISRWIVIAVILVFLVVLLSRCHRAASVMNTQQQAVNVSRETLPDEPFTPEKAFVSIVSRVTI